MASDEGSHAHGDVVAFPSARRGTAPVSDESPGLREVIGEVLRDERHRQGRTLVDVAADAAVSVQYLSEVERGRKDVSSDVLGAVHQALGLELADVLERATRRLRTVRAERGHGLRMLAA